MTHGGDEPAPPAAGADELASRAPLTRSPSINSRHLITLTSWMIGGLALLSAIASWVGGAEVAQRVQQSNAFNKPYFIVWFNHLWLAPFLPFGLLWIRMSYNTLPLPWTLPTDPSLSPFGAVCLAWGITPRKLAWKAAWLSVMYLVPNLCWFWALFLTSVSSVTAIFNASCIFVYLFSLLLLDEQFNSAKLAAVLIVASGAGLVGLSSRLGTETHQPTVKSPLGGAVVALVGACLYGLFEVAYKRFGLRSPHVPEPVPVAMVWMGAMGIGTLVVCWLGLPVLHVLGWEDFSWPPRAVLLPLCVNALCSLVFNASLMLSLAILPSPTFVSVAVMLTIPTTMLTDHFVHGASFNIYYVAGALLVTGGFGLLSVREIGPTCATASQRYEPLQPHPRSNNGSDDEDVDATGHGDGVECDTL